MKTDIKLFGTLSLSALLLLSGCGQDSSLPREEGSPEMKAALQAYVAEAERDSIDINTIMVVRGGKVVAEAYVNGWTADDPHQMWSTTKSFASFAIGYAIEEGLLSLDDKLVDMFPKESGAVLDTLSSEVYAANLRKATLKDLLVMGCGHRKDSYMVLLEKCFSLGLNNPDSLEAFVAANNIDVVQEFFKVPFEEEPGTFNCYNSIGSHLLSVIIHNVTGERLKDYLQPRLFDPLGIEKPAWTELQGNDCGGWGLFLKPEDMAKVGVTMLNYGRYAGKQVLPEQYIKEASQSWFKWDTPSWCAPGEGRYYATGYGYQIWQNPDSYFTAGRHGQFIFVFEPLDAVVSVTAEVTDDDYKEAALVWKHILPVLVKEASQPETEAD